MQPNNVVIHPHKLKTMDPETLGTMAHSLAEAESLGRVLQTLPTEVLAIVFAPRWESKRRIEAAAKEAERAKESRAAANRILKGQAKGRKARPSPKKAAKPAPRVVRSSKPDPKAQEALLKQLERVRTTGASAESLRVSLGISAGQVKGLLKRAKDAGLIRSEGEKRNTRYYVNAPIDRAEKSNGAAAHASAEASAS